MQNQHYESDIKIATEGDHEFVDEKYEGHISTSNCLCKFEKMVI